MKPPTAKTERTLNAALAVMVIGVAITCAFFLPALPKKERPQTLGERLRELENSPRGQQLKAEASAEYKAEQREKAEQQALIDAKVKAALDLVNPNGPPPAKFGN